MKPKENEFCEFYCLTENPREAAFKAGYRLFPEKKGLALLRNAAVRNRIAELKKEGKNSAKEDFKTGLRRIAFGSYADAVKLMFFDVFTLACTSLYREPKACFLASPTPYLPAITSFAKSTIDFVS